jgi:hypothetical protein
MTLHRDLHAFLHVPHYIFISEENVWNKNRIGK